MTTTLAPPSKRRSTAPAAVSALARIEAARLLRHPVLPVGLALSGVFAWNFGTQPWSGAAYGGLPPAFGPLLLAISIACASAAAREHQPVCDDAPVDRTAQGLARVLAGLVLVGGVAVLTAAGAVWLRLTGGLDLGDEPGRTLHAHYTLPELLQPVLLALFAVAVGLAAGHLLKARLVAPIVLFVGWFVCSATYYVFNGPSLIAMSVIQVQPMTVEAGPASTDPSTFPSEWLLTQPGPYQDFWGRLVVSPGMAAWHDAYLGGLTLVALAATLPGRPRRPLAAAGVVLTVVAVIAQKWLQP